MHRNIDKIINVYCSTCLELVPILSDDEFICKNEKCISPYHFKSFINKEEAHYFFDVIESWRPKYIFFKNNYWIVTYNNDKTQPIEVNTLSDLIDNDTLHLLVAGLSEEINCSVTIIESNGNRTDKFKTSSKDGVKLTHNCSPFCEKIWSTISNGNKGDELCKAFDKRIFNEIMQSGETDYKWYQCWAGLVDYAVPLYIDNKLLSVIFSGQKFLITSDQILNTHYKTSISEVNEKLMISKKELLNLSIASTDNCTTQYEIENKYIPEFLQVVKRIKKIAENSFINKKIQFEELFLEEASYYLEHTKDGFKGIKNIFKVLNRLCEFFYLKECYFLYTYDRYKLPYEIFASGSKNYLSEEEKKFRIEFKSERFKGYDTISLFELSNIEKYQDDYNSFLRVLTSKDLKIIIGTIPLVGNNHGILLFINPKEGEKLENRKLSEIDKNFLRRFCVTLRDKLNSELSFSIVLTKIGHELGSSVQALIASEKNIMKNIDNKIDVMNCVEKNINELSKYNFLIDNLKSIYIKSYKSAYNIKKLSLLYLLEEVCSILEHEALEENKIELLRPILEKPFFIEMDYQLLRRAFFNIIHNAIKYSFYDKYVSIIGNLIRYDNEDLYKIEICNFGVGITDEEIKRRLIFKEGYRGLLSKDRNRTGTGLGLSMAEDIIKNHNGFIRVISVNPVTLKESSHNTHKKVIKYLKNETLILENAYLNLFEIYLPFYQKDYKMI